MAVEGEQITSTFSQIRQGIKSSLITTAATGIAGGIVAAIIFAWALVKTVPGWIGLTPTGAVMSFDLKEGCPSGWSTYDKGSGRFIIGAATKAEIEKIPGPFTRDGRGIEIAERAFGLPGGEQQHLLTPQEMPAHTHRLLRNPDTNGNGLYPSAEKMGSSAPQNVADTVSAGGNQPHSIMPPYVALWLCKKD